jgi:hypothetical protein
MGYYVSYEIGGVVVPSDKAAACLQAINDLHTDENLLANAGGGRFGAGVENEPVSKTKWYSWVDNPPPGGFRSLVDAFAAWRFEAEGGDDGEVGLLYFEGEKLGDEEILFRTIAPFVEPGGAITGYGEEHESWVFEFNGQGVEEKSAVPVYGGLVEAEGFKVTNKGLDVSIAVQSKDQPEIELQMTLPLAQTLANLLRAEGL